MHGRSLISRTVRILLLTILIAGGVWALHPVLAQDGADATVVPDVLNMRHGPGGDYTIVAHLARGTALTLSAQDDIPSNGVWLYAQTPDGTTGWVLFDYLKIRPDFDHTTLPVRAAPEDSGTPLETPAEAALAPAGEAAPVAFPEGSGIPAQILAVVNMRTGPGGNYPVITMLSSGTSVLAKGRNAVIDWILVSTGNQDGWVYYNYVTLTSGDISQLPITNTITTPGAALAPDTEDESGASDSAFVPAPVAGGAGLAGFGYGGHVDSFAHPDKMAYAGMTWVKRQLRFGRGASGSEAAGMINQAHANGFKIVLGILGHNPQDVLEPGYFEDYARFVGEVATLGPDAIEVWNEQNIDREWANGHIDPASYTQLLALSYNAIKSANPNVAVISGALAPTGAEGAFGAAAVWNDDRYLQGMAAAGAANYMDCIGAHYNEGIVSPRQTAGDPRSEYYTRYFWGMVNMYYGAFGGRRPVCFTELGYVSPEGFGPLPGHYAWGANTSVEEQAQWLADAVRLARNSGKVRLVIIWNVDFTQYAGDPMAGYAIIRPGGSCPACDTLAAIR